MTRETPSVQEDGNAARDRIPDAEIRAELERILASELFTRSERLSSLLKFIVDQTLAGKANALKEYVLGIEVFGKGDSFDVRTDTIVRVQARRLRSALTEYYAGTGEHDAIVIEVPVGGYVPSFHRRAVELGIPGKLSRRLMIGMGIASLAAVGCAGWWWTSTRRATAESVDSIAVLPFIDLTLEKDQGYFCDGLTEEIINTLATLERPLVVGRTSVFQFKRREGDIREIGRQLGVSAVLEGSIRKAGNRFLILCQLINVVDGYHFWSESYDRESRDVLALQHEIAQAVARALRLRLSGKPSGTRVPEAYALYLEGRFHWNKWTVDGLQTSIRYYEQAVAKDPNYALAFAGLADTYGVLGHLGILPFKEANGSKERFLTRALQLDPELPEARASLAMTQAYYEWNWAEAEREFRRTLALHLNQ